LLKKYVSRKTLRFKQVQPLCEAKAAEGSKLLRRGTAENFSKLFRIAGSDFRLHHDFLAGAGRVGAATRASGMTGDAAAAILAFAKLRSTPCLGGKAGTLLHLGRSALWCCHNFSW
jgi:hypothetical protein